MIRGTELTSGRNDRAYGVYPAAGGLLTPNPNLLLVLQQGEAAQPHIYSYMHEPAYSPAPVHCHPITGFHKNEAPPFSTYVLWRCLP